MNCPRMSCHSNGESMQSIVVQKGFIAFKDSQHTSASCNETLQWGRVLNVGVFNNTCNVYIPVNI